MGLLIAFSEVDGVSVTLRQFIPIHNRVKTRGFMPLLMVKEPAFTRENRDNARR
jgi:hypothetical protein